MPVRPKTDYKERIQVICLKTVSTHEPPTIRAVHFQLMNKWYVISLKQSKNRSSEACLSSKTKVTSKNSVILKNLQKWPKIKVSFLHWNLQCQPSWFIRLLDTEPIFWSPLRSPNLLDKIYFWAFLCFSLEFNPFPQKIQIIFGYS